MHMILEEIQLKYAGNLAYWIIAGMTTQGSEQMSKDAICVVQLW